MIILKGKSKFRYQNYYVRGAFVSFFDFVFISNDNYYIYDLLKFQLRLLFSFSLIHPICTVRPNLVGNAQIRELIRCYHNHGYTYKDICGFILFTHHIIISLRSIKRIVKSLGLTRRKCRSNLEDVITKICHLQRNGYEHYGYKAMWNHLNTQCGVSVSQENVRLILRAIDPTGVELRKRNNLRRRQYISRGPHFIVHVDGYDKLKPFGISIHGAIDGFSRKILWLKAGPTNKNPKVVANHFINYLTEEGRLPRLLRCDAGTENVLIKNIQIALRSYHSDSMRGQKSVSIGRSTANQRIEMLWSFLKKHFTQFWRNTFKDMIDQNILNNTDAVHLECVRFCFLPIIQDHLDSFRQTWNIHRIRAQRRGELVSGIPNVLFRQPILYGATDCSFDFPCDMAVLQDIQREYNTTESSNLLRGCTEDFIRLVELVANQRRENFPIPVNAYQGKELYCSIITLIERFY
ncbi:hypothetical protein FSP39_019860 [Pinctada imbricata]|uniref:Integrase core domain-containing protein n=1 Tax=Pinctada imbricata TaxID=66713 RepID=A0AA88YKT8_PINIB|nr:hypothetical protein FSP39_019860 [Pinctada imbricata]